MSMHRYEKPIVKNCAMCGNEMKAYSPNHKYCDDCAKYRSNARNIAQRETRKGVRKKAKPPVVPSKSIEDILKIANTNGISYGKAVMLLSKEGA